MGAQEVNEAGEAEGAARRRVRAQMPPEVSNRMLITSQTGLWEQKWRFGIVWECSGLAEETSLCFSA